MEDKDVYLKFKRHRKWHNKLWLSEELGYDCGPGGTAPNTSQWYIVRPIMNLRGMGLDARKVFIDSGDTKKVGPGEFWCEWFEGAQYSVEFERSKSRWSQSSCYRAERDVNDLTRFSKWVRYEHKIFTLSSMFDELLNDFDLINVEYIDDLPIEVHLRKSPDPKYNEIIPIWSDCEQAIDIYTKMGYNYIESKDDCDGLLKIYRKGFMVK